LELAAVLGDGIHTYTLVAQTPGSVLLLPIEALHQAFQSFPPLRMRLLEELAREVSRAYHLCSLSRLTRARRRPGFALTGQRPV
jgi:CRP-like cAMP-binding protein